MEFELKSKLRYHDLLLICGGLQPITGKLFYYVTNDRCHLQVGRGILAVNY